MARKRRQRFTEPLALLVRWPHLANVTGLARGVEIGGDPLRAAEASADLAGLIEVLRSRGWPRPSRCADAPSPKRCVADHGERPGGNRMGGQSGCDVSGRLLTLRADR